jgi:protein MAK11
MKRQAAGQRSGANVKEASSKRVKLQANEAVSKASSSSRADSYKTKSTNGSSKGKPAQSSIKGKQRATEDAVPSAPVPKPAATAFEIVAGSYERILYGLHCTLSGKGEDASVDMQPIFQFPAHLTCVKACEASPNGRFLVTGSADEVIKLWDLKRRKEVGGLLAHDSELESMQSRSFR